MTVGVRFCGGCRSLYDRGLAFEAVKEACPGFSFEYFTAGSEYDMILVINGCFSACTELPGADENTTRIDMGPEEADNLAAFAEELKSAAGL